MVRRLAHGASLMALGAWGVAYRYLPRSGAYAPDVPPQRGSLGVLLHDRPFLLFMGASVFSWLVYVAYETVLPVSLMESHGLPEWGWGLLIIVNPLLVTFFQLRLTRAVEHVPAAPKYLAALLLMGLPFLLFGVTSAIPVILVVLIVFVIGEMLWVSTSQTVVAGLAPADVRGAYMGAFGGTAAVGFRLAPFLGLQVRGSAGDTAMWAAFAGVAVVGGVLGALACRWVRQDDADAPGSALLGA